jgi:hypothetical protein
MSILSLLLFLEPLAQGSFDGDCRLEDDWLWWSEARSIPQLYHWLDGNLARVSRLESQSLATRSRTVKRQDLHEVARRVCGGGRVTLMDA